MNPYHAGDGYVAEAIEPRGYDITFNRPIAPGDHVWIIQELTDAPAGYDFRAELRVPGMTRTDQAARNGQVFVVSFDDMPAIPAGTACEVQWQARKRGTQTWHRTNFVASEQWTR